MFALIAGKGMLPTELVSRVNNAPVVCALEGFAPDTLSVDVSFRLETLGSLIADLKGRGVTQICMAGAIGRPKIDPTAIDPATMPLVPTLQKALGQGDDGALRAVIEIFENAGFSVLAAHQIAPDLLLSAGCETDVQPSVSEKKDAERGAAIVAAMSVADVGQACVILKQQALAIEGVFGTNWMLQSLMHRPDGGTGGLLFKAPKPDQDQRVDLPTIGPETIIAAAAGGLAGVVIQSGGVIVLDHATVRAECDRRGLFLWVRDTEG